MSAVHKLITDHLDIWTAADTEKKSGRGRASGNANSVYGIKKLRELILELAVRGKLVPQDSNDEPASELLKRILAEKAKLIADKKIKKDKPLSPTAEDEEHYELPSNWVWTRLGEITNFGITEKLEQIPDDMWVLDLEDIEKDTSKLLQKFKFSERRSLSDKNSFHGGDVLYGKLRPYLNKVIVADEPGVCTTEILPIRCYSTLDSDYLKNVLKSPSFVSYVNARSYGMKMPRLGTEDGRKAVFPLPPLAEQHRIVAKVDELMALCDQLEAQHNNAADVHEQLVSHLLSTLTQSQDEADFNANWQRIATHFDTLFTTESSIDTLKQTLLQLAVMGKLVPQDPNDEPASELLKRIRNEKAKLITEGKIKKDKPQAIISLDERPFELRMGWDYVRLGDIIKISSGDGLTAAQMSESGTIPVYGGNGVNGYHDKANIYKRTLVIGRVGFYCGSIHITPEHAWATDNAFTTEFSEANIYFDFLYWLLRITNLKENENATAQPVISGRKVYPIVVALPPLNEQHRIVVKINELMTLCEQLKSRITNARLSQQKIADVLIEMAVEQ